MRVLLESCVFCGSAGRERETDHEANEAENKGGAMIKRPPKRTEGKRSLHGQEIELVLIQLAVRSLSLAVSHGVRTPNYIRG